MGHFRIPESGCLQGFSLAEIHDKMYLRHRTAASLLALLCTVVWRSACEVNISFQVQSSGAPSNGRHVSTLTACRALGTGTVVGGEVMQPTSSLKHRYSTVFQGASEIQGCKL